MVFFGSLLEPDHDAIEIGHEYIKKEALIKHTGFKGVVQAFSHDTYGAVSPQLSLCLEATIYSTMAGGVLGGVADSSRARHNFIRYNQLSSYESPHLAQRAIRDRMVLSFGKGFAVNGLKLFAFSSAFTFLCTAIPAYRGKHSPFDAAASCGMAGMIYKFQQGPKPMLAGGVLGALMGTGLGLFVFGLLSVTGLTMEDLYDSRRTDAMKYMEKEHAKLQARREEENVGKLDPINLDRAGCQ